MTTPTYLDASATTPVDPGVRTAMEPFLSREFANPSSLHEAGQHARDAVELSRLAIARILNCSPSEIFFTSGGTESINWALKGALKASAKKHIITTAIEHHAVLETCAYLKAHESASVTIVPVDKDGRVTLSTIEQAITPHTLLISAMYVNNELGTIQPVQDIGALARKHKVLFHVDACQAGLLDLDVKKLNCDLLSLNASKLEGPKGVGLLYVRSGVKLVPLLHGGGQEHGQRSGTENVPGIVGFAKALELAQAHRGRELTRMKQLQQTLEQGLAEAGATINGAAAPRTAITSATFTGSEAESLLLQLSDRKVFVSTGSACATKQREPSHVLRAIGLSPKDAHATLRFSLSRNTTVQDIERAVNAVKDVLLVRNVY
jgi:cysteine desulfurase